MTLTGGSSTGPGSAPDEGAPVRVGVAQRVVARYGDLDEAERAMRSAVDDGFPIEQAVVVGWRPSEAARVVARVSAGGATAWSAGFGTILGALLGWLLPVFALAAPLIPDWWLAVNGAILGGAVGAGLGLLAHALTGGRLAVTVAGLVRVGTYEVLVDADQADRAVRALRVPDAGEAGFATHDPGTPR